MLAEVETATPSVEWVTHIPEKSYGVTISLPHDCFVSATLNVAEDSRRLYIDMISVNENLRSEGIGQRLLKKLLEEAKKYEATELYGHITGVAALKARAAVVGSQNLKFYSHATKKPIEGMTIEEAIKESHDGNLSYDVGVDLTK